jgi:hypothetical protein
MIGTVPRPNRQVGVFPEANAAAEIVLAAEKDQQWLIDAIDFSYSGTPTGGMLTVISGSQTLYKMYLTQSGAFRREFVRGLQCPRESPVTVTLSAGGEGISGTLHVQYR